MQDLIKQEQFEIEVLDKLNTFGLLKRLAFCGGTMLRLCYGLNRYSVDLDFWIIKKKPATSPTRLFASLKHALGRSFILSDAADKYHTLLFELRSRNYPRGLKLEIRKKPFKPFETERVIAYTRHSNIQVFVTAVSLKDIMTSKIECFLTRNEIRDVFDIEFLVKKGIPLGCDRAQLLKIQSAIGNLTKKDYTVKLGSILDSIERKYYIAENFRILKAAINEKLAAPG